MKTVFVVNPKAGKKNNIEKLVESIKEASKEIEADVEIYQTRAAGDATLFVHSLCERYKKVRFISCGGDGTLGEVLNGAFGFEEAEVGVLPMGTGNDFVKNFDGSFSDIQAQIMSESEKCDVIRYVTTTPDGNTRTGYCANMFNIGFDCNVADAMADMKKKPLVSGSLAYILAIFSTLIKKKGADVEIELDGKNVHNGKLLLTSIANGKFCGGGIMSNPGASVHDGLMNVNVVYNVSRLNFIRLLPYYMKGTHLSLRGIEKIISNYYCKKIKIKPCGTSMRICVDGEIESAGETTFEILHDAMNFVVPHKLSEKECAVQTV